MEKELNIAAILKDKPNAKLWSPIVGNCTFKGFSSKNGAIVASFVDKDGELLDWDFNEYGKTYSAPKEAEVCLFPSKSMRDWSRFAWKKGDVLIMDGYRVVFDKWLNDDYTRFNAVHLITSLGGYIDKPLQNRYSPISNFITRNWRKMTDAETKIYMDSLERECGGKLNRETLVVEKPHLEFKDGDIAFADYGNRQEVFIVSGKTNLSEGYNSFISLNLRGLTLSMGYRTGFFKKNLCELRLATEEEKQQLFGALEKEGKAWNAEKKMLVDLPKKCEFKPFDKVLVRDSESDKWRANLFGYISEAGYYCCVFASWAYCIPYAGNEHLLGTTKDVEG